MKINLTEGFVRALARNILFENNENIEMHEMLQEMNMSPEKTASYGSNINPQAGNYKLPGFDRPGPNTKSRQERTNFAQHEESELEDDFKLPIGNNVNFEIKNGMNLKDKNVESVKRKKR